MAREIRKVLKHNKDGSPKTDQVITEETLAAKKGGFEMFETNKVYDAYAKDIKKKKAK